MQIWSVGDVAVSRDLFLIFETPLYISETAEDWDFKFCTQRRQETYFFNFETPYISRTTEAIRLET